MVSNGPKTGILAALMSQLTPLERQVIGLRERGLAVKQVAETTRHSPSSIKKALERIYRKSNAHSTIEALNHLRPTRCVHCRWAGHRG